MSVRFNLQHSWKPSYDDVYEPLVQKLICNMMYVYIYMCVCDIWYESNAYTHQPICVCTHTDTQTQTYNDIDTYVSMYIWWYMYVFKHLFTYLHITCAGVCTAIIATCVRSLVSGRRSGWKCLAGHLPRGIHRTGWQRGVWCGWRRFIQGTASLWSWSWKFHHEVDDWLVVSNIEWDI